MDCVGPSIGWKIKAGTIDCYGIGKRLVSPLRAYKAN